MNLLRHPPELLGQGTGSLFHRLPHMLLERLRIEQHGFECSTHGGAEFFGRIFHVQANLLGLRTDHMRRISQRGVGTLHRTAKLKRSFVHGGHHRAHLLGELLREPVHMLLHLGHSASGLVAQGNKCR
ncbi:hypothetical protein D3C85_815820 [compost metagenome]